MTLKLVTEPTIEPISLVQAKLHLKVDDSTDDSLITSLIVAAREYCEGYQNRAYCQQTWDMWLDSMPYRDIRIPLPPLQSVTSVKHYDANDMEYTLASTEYLVDDKSEPGRIVLVSNNWATALRSVNGVVIRFIAGYGVGGTEEEPDYAIKVPQKVKQAMLLLIGHWYEQRQAANKDISKEIEFSVKALLSLDRVMPI